MEMENTDTRIRTQVSEDGKHAAAGNSEEKGRGADDKDKYDHRHHIHITIRK